jgi:hypothetical protein
MAICEVGEMSPEILPQALKSEIADFEDAIILTTPQRELRWKVAETGVVLEEAHV